MRLRPGPGPHTAGAYSNPPDILAGLRGHLKGREEGEGRGEKVERKRLQGGERNWNRAAVGLRPALPQP